MKLFSGNKETQPDDVKRKKRIEALWLIISGVLIGISYPPIPFPLSLLIFIGFIPYLLVIERRDSLLSLNRASYLMVFVLGLITLYWVGSWQEKADLFLMLGGLALVFVYPAVFMIPTTLYYFTKKIFPSKIALWLFPVYWITTEYLLTLTDLRFPWLTLGNSLTKFISFIQIAEIIGVYGLSLIILMINILLLKTFTSYTSGKIKIGYAILAFLIFLFVLVYGFVRINDYKIPDKKLRVGLIQPNLDPWDKWDTGGLTDLTDKYLQLSQKAIDDNAELIIWPETALPVFLAGGSYPNLLNKVYSFLEKNNVPLLTGMPDINHFHETNRPGDAKHYSGPNSYYYTTYNSIMLLQPGTREIQKYGKMKLVPLGERVPFVDQIPFLGDFFKWGVGLGGWNVGQDTIVFKTYSNNLNDSIKINGLVCFESVFPDFVTNFVEKDAQFIAVVTNDSWYGNSSGPYQHKEIAVLRAVENRRSVVRSANGGISSFINPLGITKAETEMFTEDVLVIDVPLEERKTFYTENSQIITGIFSAFSLWILALRFLQILKKKLKV